MPVKKCKRLRYIDKEKFPGNVVQDKTVDYLYKMHFIKKMNITSN